MENQFFIQANKQKLDITPVLNNQLESTKFRLLSNFVFYFNCSSGKSNVDIYVEQNADSLNYLFKVHNKTLIIVNSQNLSQGEMQAIQYYFPAFQVTGNNYNPSKALLEYFGYSGNIQSGFLAHNSALKHEPEISIIELYPDTDFNQLDLFFESYAIYIQSNHGYLFEPVKKISSDRLYFQPFNLDESLPDEIQLDKETRSEIKLILDKIEKIKEKGNFIALLPVLEKYLKEQKQSNNKISRLYIDQEYRIWLKDYNIEIKLSHLTKAIYFLFLFRGHKINLSELGRYKKQLINIYINISNQENLDKMLQSINLLLKNKNTIYVHLSRIKAAFHKVIYKDIAQQYCIQGAKNEPKFINLDKSLTNIQSFREIWFPQKPRTIQDIADENEAMEL